MTTAAAAVAPPSDPSTAPPPRKRRRRTATSGATDDCFTCRKRAITCDRKRPYCTQCIDIGKECSGYKTNLTWGVGVASRGKLRGLSCPVVHKKGDANNTSSTPVAAGRRKSSVHQKDGEPLDTVPSNNPNAHPRISIQLPLSSPAPAPAIHTATPPVSIPPSQQAWSIPAVPTVQNPYSVNGVRRPSFGDPSLQRLQTTFPTPYDPRGAPQSATSMGSYAETEFHSPLEYPRTPNSISLSERMQPPHSTSYNHQPVIGSPTDNMNLYSISPVMYPDIMGSGIGSLSAPTGLFQDHVVNPHDPDLNVFGSGMLGHDGALISPFGAGHFEYDAFEDSAENFPDDDTRLVTKGMDLTDSRFSNPFFHIAPRTQYLMNYYDRNICPFIVAFDGPENPYRKHILQLSLQNEGLQNALAALATNNYRMRQQPPPRRHGYVEEIPDSITGAASNPASEPSREESHYKQMSIDQLNMQLTDPRAARDDSVLATLLILCLFHVCDSGFSKFKTQLAGVQKLLNLRGPVGQSDFTRWVEMFFIWFDVMTSTVNDREMQIKPESLDMLDFSANLGALEQFSGCDGRLFKLIARLGRLNLLAQGRPVRQQDRIGKDQKPAQRKQSTLNKPLTARDFENIDGNGWGTPIFASDEDLEGSGDDYSLLYSTMGAPDSRGEFLNEWYDIRQRLQAWEMDPATAAAGHIEFVHINESFRFSALLYTERLGNPFLASSHPNFQQYVSKALHHIRALPVTSCVNKFLLWPLFIAGTECVDPHDREVVRSRCIEIQQESGFFNNLSSLEVLERVWHDSDNDSHHMRAGVTARMAAKMPLDLDGLHAVKPADEEAARRRDSEAARTGLYGPAFRWRKAMDRVDGEYIVI